MGKKTYIQLLSHGLILQENIVGLLCIHNYGDAGTRPENVIPEIMELFCQGFCWQNDCFIWLREQMSEKHWNLWCVFLSGMTAGTNA